MVNVVVVIGLGVDGCFVVAPAGNRTHAQYSQPYLSILVTDTELGLHRHVLRPVHVRPVVFLVVVVVVVVEVEAVVVDVLLVVVVASVVGVLVDVVDLRTHVQNSQPRLSTCNTDSAVGLHKHFLRPVHSGVVVVVVAVVVVVVVVVLTVVVVVTGVFTSLQLQIGQPRLSTCQTGAAPGLQRHSGTSPQ